MPRHEPLSILFYAINGRGLGHLTRLLAIARAARELFDALEWPCDLQFVTTSEASFVADDFPVYKLPSKTVLARAHGARDRHVQHAKLLVSNLVAAMKPDVLVLDTVPYGAFQELAFVRSYARTAAYVYRHQDPAVATSELVQRHLDLFDRILVPDDDGAADDYPVPRGARKRLAFVGRVHGFDHARAWSRERVREYFGVQPDQRLILVAAGGGGDGRDALVHLVRAVAADERSFVLAGYGPLHRGDLIHAPNVVPLTEGNASRFFPGLDAAVSAAGYNAYEELLAARVPALFFAQPKGMDRQDLRVARGLGLGLHGELPSADASADVIRGRLEQLLDGELGTRVRAALAERAPPQGALGAAVEIAALCPGVDRAALYELAAWRRDAPAELASDFVPRARAFLAWRRRAAAASELARERDAGAARWWNRGAGAAPEALAAGAELVELEARLGLAPAVWEALLAAFADNPGARSESSKRLVLVDALRAILDAHRHDAGARIAALGENEPRRVLRESVLALAAEADALGATGE